jgi:hypothetical protein
VNSRTIVTSHPDIACEVCERRLLRGEQHETFLVAGQPRTVCELCASRAAHQGWKRISDLEAASIVVARPRRARGIFDRLRAGRAHPIDAEGDRADARGRGEGSSRSQAAQGDARFADLDLGGEVADALGEAPVVEDPPLVRALEIFNQGEYPRRVGGVARSLGSPEVSVRELDVAGLVSILVAWELCWYRYRVDLDDLEGGAQLVAQGTELSELERDEREGNAVADERGALHIRAGG